MSVRSQVKRALRMCGHALVSTIHERLDNWERQTNDLGTQFTSLAETQGALLQTSIHVVESLHELRNDILLERGITGQKVQLLDSLRTQIAALTESQRALQEAIVAFQRDRELRLDSEQPLKICVETNEYEFRNPELGLMAHLYSSLPTPRAIDVGAHVGEVSEGLLDARFEVFAFEPNPPVYEKLVQRLGDRVRFHPFNFAIGARDEEMLLHLAEDLSPTRRHRDETIFSSLVLHTMPEDLPYTGARSVPVRSLASLHESGSIPEDISLLKIDTEGFDLEVVHGMSGHRYPVVVAEYWGTDTPFGKAGVPYTLESLVRELRPLGYPYHIVIYRVYGPDQPAYYCNYPKSIPNTTGNVFFFRDFAVFAEAQAWCSAVLPKTIFKPARPS